MELLSFFDSIRTPFLDFLARLFAFAGSGIIFLIIVTAVYWCVNKKSAFKLILSYMAAVPITALIRIIIHVRYSWTETGLCSMPYGGAVILGLTLVVLFSDVRRFKHRIVFIAVTVISAFSMIFLGRASLADVLVGLAAGIAGAVIIHRVLNSIALDKSIYFPMFAISLIGPIALLCVSLALYYNDIIVYGELAEALRIAGAGAGMMAGWYIECRRIGFKVSTDRLWKQLAKLAIGWAVIVGF
ncbi:MAG: hypothetical protein HUJ75_01965, partial [Parasporobacterium sp.]|nr:hypothetical protein [Parasporobacterium sp.]